MDIHQTNNICHGYNCNIIIFMITSRAYSQQVDPKFLAWSHQETMFSRANQWAKFVRLGCFPLVLDPIISNVRFEKVLINSESALDILFCNALTKLGLKLENLEPYNTPFRGVLPR